jgi:mannose-1-phosphate guanylyltransferase
MKVVLFAGGVGSRLWPLSRKNAPKQFGKIIGDKTMLQIAVGKLFPDFSWDDIYISTGKHYKEQVKEQLPELPGSNILVEPEMRDVGPAVGLVTALFVKKDPNEPIALLWGSDHLVRREELFRKTLKTAEEIVRKNKDQIIFIAQKPRFASQNLGYIAYGPEIEKINGLSLNKFTGFKYRPHLSTAERWMKSGQHAWNLGYFVTTPQFLWKQFEEFAPELFLQLKKIKDSVGTSSYEKILHEVYPKIEKISFDNAVLEKMNPNYGCVIPVDLEWSDIGAWEALKEALSNSVEENVTRGNVMIEDCEDSLIFNLNEQLVVGIDLKEMVVVNTNDVTLICPKASVPKIKKLVESLNGTEHEDLV